MVRDSATFKLQNTHKETTDSPRCSLKIRVDAQTASDLTHDFGGFSVPIQSPSHTCAQRVPIFFINKPSNPHFLSHLTCEGILESMDSEYEPTSVMPFHSPVMPTHGGYRFNMLGASSLSTFTPGVGQLHSTQPGVPHITESPSYNRSYGHSITPSTTPFSPPPSAPVELTPGQVTAGNRKEALKAWSDRVAMQKNLTIQQIEDLRAIIKVSS